MSARRRDPPTRVRPVPRHRVLAAVVGAGLALVAIGSLTEQLRHPLATVGPEFIIPPDEGDPRDEVECPQPPPREGQEEGDTAQAPLPAAVEVDSNALYDCPRTYEDRLVRYEGEVVGAVLRRGGGAWVQLNDDIYAGDLGPLPAHRDYRGGNAGVGVFLPHELADEITFVGGPQARGDILAVQGVFQRVDPDSHEVTVIRASAGEVVQRGEPFVDPVLTDRRIAAAVVALVTLALFIAHRVTTRRDRETGVQRRS